MSAQAHVSVDPASAPGPASRAVPWAALAWFSVLLCALFFPVIQGMVDDWINDEDMSHGFFVPAVAAYIAWQRKEELAATAIRPFWGGYVLLAAAFLLLMAGTLGADFFLMRAGFLISILGVLLALLGWPMVRVLALPLLLLPFMVRIPLFIYSQITFPLQIFASQVAETVLSALGYVVLREGNILELPGQRLSVVEACSGIRSLLSLTFLSLVYGYLFESKIWVRAALFLSTIPIAIGANAARVTLTGIISEYDRKLSEGVYHSFEGWVIFMVALAALGLTHLAINRIAGHFGKQPPAPPSTASASHA